MPMPMPYLDPSANAQRNSITSALMNIQNPQPQTQYPPALPQMPNAPAPGAPPQGMPPGAPGLPSGAPGMPPGPVQPMQMPGQQGFAPAPMGLPNQGLATPPPQAIGG